MSDTPQGVGWWLGADGKYYPPVDQRPDEPAPGLLFERRLPIGAIGAVVGALAIVVAAVVVGVVVLGDDEPASSPSTTVAAAPPAPSTTVLDDLGAGQMMLGRMGKLGLRVGHDPAAFGDLGRDYCRDLAQTDGTTAKENLERSLGSYLVDEMDGDLDTAIDRAEMSASLLISDVAEAAEQAICPGLG